MTSGKDNYISLQEATKYCEHSQEYLSLRARQGKLKAVKIGRNWVTKKEWLEKYLNRVVEYNNNLKTKKTKKVITAKKVKVKKVEKEVLVPRNLPIGEFQLAEVRPLHFRVREMIQEIAGRAVRSPAFRFGFAWAMVFVLIIAGGVFGRASLEEVMDEVGEVGEIGKKIVEESFSVIHKDIEIGLSKIESKISKDEIYSAAVYETVDTFKEYGRWLDKGFKNQISKIKKAPPVVTAGKAFNFVWQNTRKGYIATNNFVEENFSVVRNKISQFGEKIVSGIRQLAKAIASAFPRTTRFVFQLFRAGWQRIRQEYIAVNNYIEEKISRGREGVKGLADWVFDGLRFIVRPWRILPPKKIVIDHTKEIESLREELEKLKEEGPIGLAGPPGPVGSPGPIGLMGLTGLTGSRGSRGNRGPEGPPGSTGSTGSFAAGGDINAGAIAAITTTTPQLKVGYDNSNYSAFSIDASGDLTLTVTGGDISLGSANLTTTGTSTAAYFYGDGSNLTGIGAGGGAFATSTDLIYPQDTGYDFVVGSNATSTAPFWVEVPSGNATITGNLTAASSTLSGNLDVTGTGTFGDLVVDTNTLVVNAIGYEGNVGIGTTGPGAKLDIDYDEIATAAGSYYGFRSDTDSTGIFTAGTANVYGLYGDVTSSGVSTGGTVNTYGGYFTATGEDTGAATTNAYGLYVNGATGADNNYSAVFMNGNVGIGTASPSSTLHVIGDLTVSATSTLATIDAGVWQGDTVAVGFGGTGQTSYTDGQLLIGNTTGNTLTKATLTQGTGITITNGSGSVTIANASPNVDQNLWETISSDGGSTTADTTTDTLTIAGSGIASTAISPGSDTLTITATEADNLASVTGRGATTADAVTVGNFTSGADGADGKVILYSEQGGTDYTVSLNPNSAMTSNADFYLPADEPAGTYLLNMTTGGVIDYDTSSYITGNQTITLSGDVTGSGATAITTAIGADKITEAMLKEVDGTPADEDILTYETTTGDFQWHTPSELITAGTLISWTGTTLNVDNNLHNYSWANVVDADIPDAITVTGYMQDEDINTFSELDAWVTDKALVNKADGAVWLGVHDFGGATSFELPQSDTPTTDATGEIALDTTITGHQPLWQYYDG
ncbi:hypothetical protein KJA13_03555, partial [Patescibacteria group bacterium]|nr:hypothetical protein [Patescibacteria group bacterium]